MEQGSFHQPLCPQHMEMQALLCYEEADVPGFLMLLHHGGIMRQWAPGHVLVNDPCSDLPEDLGQLTHLVHDLL